MDKSLMLKEISKHYNFKKDVDLARFLDISPERLYTWLKRNTFDEKIILTKCQDIDASWLITGEGEMLKAEIQAVEKPILTSNKEDRLLALMERQQKSIEDLISNNAKQANSMDKQAENMAKLIDANTKLSNSVIELSKKGTVGGVGGVAKKVVQG